MELDNSTPEQLTIADIFRIIGGEYALHVSNPKSIEFMGDGNLFFRAKVKRHSFKTTDKALRCLIMYRKKLWINLGLGNVTNNRCEYIDSNFYGNEWELTLKILL